VIFVLQIFGTFPLKDVMGHLGVHANLALELEGYLVLVVVRDVDALHFVFVALDLLQRLCVATLDALLPAPVQLHDATVERLGRKLIVRESAQVLELLLAAGRKRACVLV
jgi:hypothetical protein